jgi:ankyrin repeat protein
VAAIQACTAFAADALKVDIRDDQGNTPLHVAARRGDVTAVRELLERGADANATNNAKATPLLYGTGNDAIVRALLEHHASTEAMTPLMSAVWHGESFALVRRLVEAGANIRATRKDKGEPKKPRVEFSLVSRDLVLRGGQSREAAIVPGYGDDSPMIQFASDKVEDLEMPPLNRRDKYPALTRDEIELLRTWIDHGAPWETAPTVSLPKSAANPVPLTPLVDTP